MISNSSELKTRTINIDESKLVDIHTLEAANKYLKDNDSNKASWKRALSWFIVFKNFNGSESDLADQFQSIYDHYNELLNHYCPAPEFLSVESISKNLDDIIPRDLNRTIKVYEKDLAEMNIDPSIFNNYFFRFHRIFLIISNENSKYDYIQGQDRYLYFIIYSTIQLYQYLQLSDPLWIEAFSATLLTEFCKWIPYDAMVPKVEELNDLFLQLSMFIEKKDPKLHSALSSQSLTPHQYALSWFLSLFSEQHNNSESFLIFDHLIANLQNLDNYMFSLCLAHLKQVSFGKKSHETVQAIISKKNWKMNDLFATAEYYISSNSKKSSYCSPGKIITTAAVVVIASFIGYIYFS